MADLDTTGVEMTVGAKVEMTPFLIADAFSHMSDEAQAQFFIEVAALSKIWGAAHQQWLLVGRHLRDCECSTNEARAMLEEITEAMQPETVGTTS